MKTPEVHVKGILLGWFVGLVESVQEIFVLPLLLWSAQYKIFFSSPDTISLNYSHSPSKLGRQPCWVACLLISVSGAGFTVPSLSSLSIV
jgi:hypothetical protein